jgi:hypothetical protein
MAKTTKLRLWTKEDVRTLKTLAREKTKTLLGSSSGRWERRIRKRRDLG